MGLRRGEKHVEAKVLVHDHPGLSELLGRNLLWVELCPPERYVGALTPSTSECDLIGNRVIANVIK